MGAFEDGWLGGLLFLWFCVFGVHTAYAHPHPTTNQPTYLGDANFPGAGDVGVESQHTPTHTNIVLYNIINISYKYIYLGDADLAGAGGVGVEVARRPAEDEVALGVPLCCVWVLMGCVMLKG